VFAGSGKKLSFARGLTWFLFPANGALWLSNRTPVRSSHLSDGAIAVWAYTPTSLPFRSEFDAGPGLPELSTDEKSSCPRVKEASTPVLNWSPWCGCSV